MRLRALRLVTVAALAAAALTAGGIAQAAPLAQHATAGIECKRGYYRNSSGHCVRRPVRPRAGGSKASGGSGAPAGATAKCRDGTYSFSEHASGTCSHHGGVAIWIRHP